MSRKVNGPVREGVALVPWGGSLLSSAQKGHELTEAKGTPLLHNK